MVGGHFLDSVGLQDSVPSPREWRRQPGSGGRLLSGVRRIAVLRANAIGDFVVALPALEALRAAYPDAEITYLGADWHAAWLSGRSGPWDRVEAVPVGPDRDDGPTFDVDPPQMDRFLREQQARRYDLVVQAHGGGANSNPFVSRP